MPAAVDGPDITMHMNNAHDIGGCREWVHSQHPPKSEPTVLQHFSVRTVDTKRARQCAAVRETGLRDDPLTHHPAEQLAHLRMRELVDELERAGGNLVARDLRPQCRLHLRAQRVVILDWLRGHDNGVDRLAPIADRAGPPRRPPGWWATRPMRVRSRRDRRSHHPR